MVIYLFLIFCQRIVIAWNIVNEKMNVRYIFSNSITRGSLRLFL
jgi:hypothetical protein